MIDIETLMSILGEADRKRVGGQEQRTRFAMFDTAQTLSTSFDRNFGA